MLAEAQKVNCIDNCNKMQTLSSNHLPDLIKSFELKVNQQKDATQVKSGGRPAAKMRLRDPAVVLEIARLRVLVSEMREKTMKMEAQLKSAASEKSSKEKRNSLDAPKCDMKDEEITTIDVKTASMLAVDKTPDKAAEITSACDINLVTTTESPLKCNGENRQDISKNENKKVLLEQRLRRVDTDAIDLQAHIERFHCEVHGMLLELSTRPDLQEELAVAKERMKALQEEIKDDASTTKAQLLLLKQQFGELEKSRHASEQKELAFRKVLHVSSALEAEVAELKKGNQELLKQKQELFKKLQSTVEKAEKIKPLTKDDVLASEAEVSKLRSTNVELQKKVESLQISRFNEVEEVVYLRWVNACLRHDLDVHESSHRNFEDISNQIENCSPVSGGRDDHMVRTNSGRSSAASYNDAHDYRASADNDSENMHEQCQQGGIKSSPQLSNNVNSAHFSPARHGRMNINISPLAIPHGLASSCHSSPLVSPLGCRDGSNSSSLASPQGHVDGSHPSSLRRLKSTHISPQKSPSGEVRMKSAGARHSTHQQSPSEIRLSQSPPADACNPLRYSLGRMQLERDPQQKVANVQSMLRFSGDQTAKLDATSRIQNFPRRSGRSLNRTASTVSATSSEGSENRTQASPQKQDRRTFMRSSSTLSADSDISNNMKSKAILRRHSASSGMSLLDEYLHSTDPRSPNRSTSRFSAVLPHNRQLSNVKTVPFATMEEVMVPQKREDSTAEKAYSFESHLDASDRVVAAFQKLSSSTPTRSSHRPFKDLSRRNSLDDKADHSNVNHQQPHKHDAPMSTTRSTQAEFICDLARAVQVACYSSIEQVSAFVNWFNRQGEVEKQEFFKFPDCPRDKVEAMRRAVYEYEELRALETDLLSYKDMLVEGPADFSLQDVKSLLEKGGNYIEGFKQARGLAIAQFNELDIPTYWMLDSGMVAKIKQAALQLARRYIKQVMKLLTTHEESGAVSMENSLVEAARFLLQLHNFVGGFDERTANAFKLLQSQVHLQESNVVCSSAPLRR